MFFTLSAIIGSATLYGDFDESTLHQQIVFLYGCATTFIGVFILAWASPPSEDEEENLVDEGVGTDEETGVGQDNDRMANGAGVRRTSGTLSLPSGSRARTIQRRRSLVGMGLSPARGLLLVHSTPPRDRWDIEDPGPARRSRITRQGPDSDSETE